ncbi:uncharacterized protein [Clytia hemisphaerica]|uniref:Cnidarian restricted protein n=1 Tax=Clytia hemisphaerica TaxID=252671 RepID=A0A7M5WTH0_9CNID
MKLIFILGVCLLVQGCQLSKATEGAATNKTTTAHENKDPVHDGMTSHQNENVMDHIDDEIDDIEDEEDDDFEDQNKRPVEDKADKEEDIIDENDDEEEEEEHPRERRDASPWGSRRRFFSNWRRRTIHNLRRRSISNWRRRSISTSRWRRRTITTQRRRWRRTAKKIGAGIIVAAGGIKKIRNKIIKELIKPKCAGCAGICEKPAPSGCRCVQDQACIKRMYG